MFIASTFASLSCFIYHFCEVYTQTSDRLGFCVYLIPSLMLWKEMISRQCFTAQVGWHVEAGDTQPPQCCQFKSVILFLTELLGSVITSALGSKEINSNGFAHSADNVSHCTCEPRHLTVHFGALCSRFCCGIVCGESFCSMPVSSVCLLRFADAYILQPLNRKVKPR